MKTFGWVILIFGLLLMFAFSIAGIWAGVIGSLFFLLVAAYCFAHQAVSYSPDGKPVNPAWRLIDSIMEDNRSQYVGAAIFVLVTAGAVFVASGVSLGLLLFLIVVAGTLGALLLRRWRKGD
jgi:hypothetical protein